VERERKRESVRDWAYLYSLIYNFALGSAARAALKAMLTKSSFKTL